MIALRARIERRLLTRRLATTIAADGRAWPQEDPTRRRAALKALRTYSADTLDLIAWTCSEEVDETLAVVLHRYVAGQRAEWRLWAFVYFGHFSRQPDGSWNVPVRRWEFGKAARLFGAEADPVLGPLLRGMRQRPGSAFVAGVTAVFAVAEEIFWAAPQHRDRLLVPRRYPQDDGALTSSPWGIDDYPPFHLANPALTRLILDRPSEADRIAAVAVERGTDDVTLIRSLLSSEAHAVLLEGEL